MDLEKLRIRDPLITLREKLPKDFGSNWESLDKMAEIVAQAQFQKLAWGLVDWLRDFERNHTRSAETISIGRGHGLEMAQEEQEFLLVEAHTERLAEVRRRVIVDYHIGTIPALIAEVRRLWGMLAGRGY